MNGIMENLGTIGVGLAVLAVVALIVRNMMRRARRGQCVCCDGCNKAGSCHCGQPGA